MVSRRLAVLSCAASLVLLVAPAASAATFERGPSLQGLVTVGYSSEAALDAAVSRAGGRVLRRLPHIGVAELSGAGRFAELLAGSPGISFLERSVTRTPSAEPGLAQASAVRSSGSTRPPTPTRSPTAFFAPPARSRLP